MTGPSYLALMLGWRCNSRCVMCFRHGGNTPRQPDRLELPTEAVLGLIDRFAETLTTVELIAFGEPMLHPGFGAIVARLTRLERVSVGCITNDSLLHEQLGLLRLPGCLTVSVDSPDPARYKRIRRGLSFERLTENLRLAVAVRGPGRQVGVAMTIFEENVREVYALGKLCAELGLSFFSTLRAIWLEATPAEGQEIPLGHPLVLEQLRRVRVDFPQLQVNDFISDARGPVGGRCRRPETDLVVFNDGTLRPCCRSFQLVLGRWDDSPPWRWDDPTRLELARGLAAGRPGPAFVDCQSCPWV